MRRFLLLRPTRHLTETLLNVVTALLARRHAAALARLEDVTGATCLIVPRDLPAAFLLTLRPAPHLRLVDPGRMPAARATIRADMATLLQLLEGRIDGDALFFSRDLTVEGDMEVVVALRNAVDDSGIDLIRDLAATCGPLAPPAERLAGHLADAARRLHRALHPADRGSRA